MPIEVCIAEYDELYILEQIILDIVALIDGQASQRKGNRSRQMENMYTVLLSGFAEPG